MEFFLENLQNKLNNIHEFLRLTTNDNDSNFNEILESSHELSIHKKCINYLMIEVCKHLHGITPELITDNFTLRKNRYNIHNICLFGPKTRDQCVLEWMQ